MAEATTFAPAFFTGWPGWEIGQLTRPFFGLKVFTVGAGVATGFGFFFSNGLMFDMLGWAFPCA